MLRFPPLLSATPARRFLAALLLASPLALSAQSTATLSVDASSQGKAISPDLVGIFFEDLSYAADGGLYAELVQNRSFEYQTTEQPSWNSLTGWELVQRGGGRGALYADASKPLHPRNPHCALLIVNDPGEGVGLANDGFDGIAVKAGEPYDFSVFARVIGVGGGRDWKPEGAFPLVARLEAKDGSLVAEAAVEPPDSAGWKQVAATLTPSRTVADCRLVLLAKSTGTIALDEVSLFPRHTFKDRKNGLRADLAHAIADLKPRFMRFPGGCLVHGDGIGNIYNWKDTIGPVEQRKGQSNIWRYHQSVGLGYFEYFQFCEDIGAAPLPVVAAGVSCQNSSRSRGAGQQAIPLADMPAYIQDLLDLVEWANGPADSPWGSVRAAAGHPAPFGLKYLGVGNEDHITPAFEERFRMIFDALRAKHPEITVIGTVGPSPSGSDFDKGWQLASALRVPVVDEHYYMAPQWFWDNLGRYDAYDRAKPKVYVGEYAAHDAKRRHTLRSAIAEAAHLTSLERNGDVVAFASYAPLLANRRHTHWRPDLIYFDNTGVYPSLSYPVQQLFALNAGDHVLPATLVGAGKPATLATSVVRDSRSGDIIVKVVNGAAETRSVRMEIKAPPAGAGHATRIVFAGPDADAANEDGKPPVASPQTETVSLAPAFDYAAPANSLTIFRLPAR